MKWLLLSSVGENPGDGMIRCGVQELIRAVDPEAVIRMVSRTQRAMRYPHPVEYDRIVLAGMAFFYSHRTSATWHESIWRAITDWAGAEPRKFLIAGVGSFAPWKAPLDVRDPELLRKTALTAKGSAYAVYVRDPVANEVTGMDFPVHVCPSVFAMRGREHRPKYKIANLTWDGSHYRRLNEYECGVFLQKQLEIARILIDAGFWFSAHTDHEADWACSALGWPDYKVMSDTMDPEIMLDRYARCRQFFGCRVHGAIPCRAAGADSWWIGYDSRAEAVRIAGARVTAPSELDLDELKAWAAKNPASDRPDYSAEWEAQTAIFRAFASGEGLP